MDYSDDQIKNYLAGIFDGSITDKNLPVDLYEAISGYLVSGLYKGAGMDLSMSDGRDFRLLSELRYNVFMFGAAKTYQQTKDISSKLLDADGNIRSRADFLSEGRKMFSTWNDDWGKSEYNTAIASGTMGVKWNDIQDQKNLFPNLRYSTIGDACDICGPLDGFTAPVDDPAWDDIYPTNHFNCKCTVLQEDGTAAITPEEDRAGILDKVTPEMDPIFMNNVGKTGSVFPEDHPYFKVAAEDMNFAKDNFGLPFPEDDPRMSKLNRNVDELLARQKDFDTLKQNTIPGTKEFTADRLILHKKILEELLSEGSSQTGTSYFMGGAPATGKSSILDKGIVKLPKGIQVIDPDKIKAKLPEYDAMRDRGSVLAAHKTHEESSILSKDLVNNIIKNKWDVHMDGVGDGEYQKIVDKVAAQRAIGQRVEAYYVTTDVEVSVKRAAARSLKTGRDVPEQYTRDMHKAISDLVPALAKNGVFDVLKLYDNNVKYGEKPILIFEQVGKKITVIDPEKYKAFLKQGSGLPKK